jgi:hypothetical protein
MSLGILSKRGSAGPPRLVDYSTWVGARRRSYGQIRQTAEALFRSPLYPIRQSNARAEYIMIRIAEGLQKHTIIRSDNHGQRLDSPAEDPRQIGLELFVASNSLIDF